jgi:hypothetical protein
MPEWEDGSVYLFGYRATIAHAEAVRRELRLEIGEHDPTLGDDESFIDIDRIRRGICQRPTVSWAIWRSRCASSLKKGKDRRAERSPGAQKTGGRGKFSEGRR